MVSLARGQAALQGRVALRGPVACHNALNRSAGRLHGLAEDGRHILNCAPIAIADSGRFGVCQRSARFRLDEPIPARTR